MSTKKSIVQPAQKLMVMPIDLLCLFTHEYSIIKSNLEKILLASNIKSFNSGGSIYKCEKIGIKFEINIHSINKSIGEIGYSVQFKKKQGNNHSFKEIISNLYIRLNEELSQV